MWVVELDQGQARRLMDWVVGKQTAVPTQVQQHRCGWWLAHSDDGLVWGRNINGVWHCSAEESFGGFSVGLSEDNLQTLRVFGEEAELMVWRRNGNWKGRVLQDGDNVPPTFQPICEDQVLFGQFEDADSAQQGGLFSLQRDGGTRQVVLPIGTPEERALPLIGQEWRLRVKHHVEQEASGAMRVVGSRLVKVWRYG